MNDRAEFAEPATQDHRLLRLYRYWNDRRGSRRFPVPADLDLVQCAYAREFMTLVEIDRDPLRFRYRMVSPQLTGHLGYDMTGRYVDGIPEPSMREFARAFYLRALDHQAPLYDNGRVLIRLEEWWHETLALPIASDGRTVDLLLVYRQTTRPIAVSGRQD